MSQDPQTFAARQEVASHHYGKPQRVTLTTNSQTISHKQDCCGIPCCSTSVGTETNANIASYQPVASISYPSGTNMDNVPHRDVNRNLTQHI